MKQKQIMLLVGAAVVLLVGGALIGSGVKKIDVPNQQTPILPPSPQTTQGGVQTPASPASPQTTTTAPKSAITITSPKAGDRWIYGTDHEIRWSKAGNFAGGIYLVDAVSRATIGWITPSLGAQQTSFTWDTENVFLSRQSSQKKQIQTGSFIIKIKFDNNQPELTSVQFSTIYPTQATVATHAIVIKNFAASPKTLTVKHGETVTFTNTDAISLHLLLSGVTTYTIAPGETVTLDTIILTAGTYEFYSDAYPSLTGSLIIQ